jgi:sugar phosphate isomerase/epimerase
MRLLAIAGETLKEPLVSAEFLGPELMDAFDEPLHGAIVCDWIPNRKSQMRGNGAATLPFPSGRRPAKRQRMKSLYGKLALGWGLAVLLTGCATEKQAGVGGSFKGPIGLQLYSLRNSFAQDAPGTMEMVRRYGFKIVELAGTYNLSIPDFNQMLESNKLIAVSGHFPYDRYKNDPEGVARDAKALGLKYAGCAWIPHEGEFDEAECRSAAAVFNRAGGVLARHGIKFFYHTHGYEFRPHAQGTLFDLLMAETKPELVCYQMDVYWIVHPGHDPAGLLKKYGKRFELMHVKDMKKGVKGDFTGKSNVNNDVILGTGQVDWTTVLNVAKQTGVKWYFIEDESDDAAQHIPQSLRFLEGIQF